MLYSPLLHLVEALKQRNRYKDHDCLSAVTNFNLQEESWCQPMLSASAQRLFGRICRYVEHELMVDSRLEGTCFVHLVQGYSLETMLIPACV